MRTIDLPIHAVTVLEDRALVTRIVTVHLESGSHALVVPSVAPTVVDKTLSVRASGATRVVQARVARRPATSRAARDEDVAEWMKREEAHCQAEDDAGLRLELASEAVASLRTVEALNLAELAEDVAVGREVGGRMAALAALRAELAEALGHEVECRRALTRASRALRDVRATLEQTGEDAQDVVAALELQLHRDADEPAEVELVVRYAVAGAMWRPAHVATMHEDGRVHVQARACVWQSTGEDWADATLSFSTERPSLGTKPPVLTTDTLSAQAKAQKVHVQARDQVIATTGEGAGEVRDEMPGVDDGGEPLSLSSTAPCTVSANGKPHHVPLFEFESAATREWVCRPELVEAVLLRTTQPHRGAHPLLAGPVELRRHGGFVGRTSTLFVAPGETFELGWGPAPELRVHRKVEPGEHTRKPLSAWVRKPRTVAVTLSNLGPTPYSVRLQERVIVSETEKVEVETGPLAGGSIDEDGILTAELSVRGFSETTYAFEWTLVVHDDVRGL